MKVRLLVASFVSLGLTWSASSFAVTYKIDPAQSTVKWVATKVKKTLDGHDGFVKIKEGTFDLEGKQEKGRFVIDMTSIENADLKDKDAESKKKLENHLKSDDFFSVSKYPEATLVLKTLTLNPKDKAEYKAAGDLTIKGITKPIAFTANVIEKDGKVQLNSKDFKIDRTEWDIRYNSTKFFDLKKLGDKAIDNEVTFDVNLVGQKK